MVLQPVKKVVREVADIVQFVDDAPAVLRLELLQRFDQRLREEKILKQREVFRTDV